ncbi:MAG: DNA replication/repair protein RecF [Candidatus Dadabacteria bacterium]
MSLYLDSLRLFSFKNYFDRNFEFPERITGICGRNGVGKTNLLDAVHYLCFTKSYFTRNDQLSIHHGNYGFRIEGHFLLNDKKETTTCILRETGKKEFAINESAYTKFSKHIGHYPCVIIAPDDVQLIIGGSEERRSFVDTLLSQLNNEYLQSLIRYTKILQQRNSFLRSFQDSFNKDLSVLDILDEQLAKEGNEIFRKRRDFLFAFLPVVKQLYNDISQRYENINLFYETEMEGIKMEDLLQTNRQKDLVVQRTSGGIHRDDLVFNLGEQAFKAIASQGQRKSLLFALKLAEVETIKQQKQLSPILLLDDVFEKLDEERIGNLLIRVSADENMQIFITDTNCQRLQEQLIKLGHPYGIISL